MTNDSPAAARLAALAEGTDFPDANTVALFGRDLERLEQSCPDDSEQSLLQYVVAAHRAVVDAGVERDLKAVSTTLGVGVRGYPALSCAEAVVAVTENFIKFELTGELPVLPTPFAGTIAPEDTPRLGPMFPDGIEFTRSAAYLDIEDRGHAESAFLFEVAAGTDVLSPVSGTVRDAFGDFIVLTDGVTGSLVVISIFLPEVETGSHVEAGERIGSVSPRGPDPSSITPPVSGEITLVVAIAAPGGGTRPKVDVTLDPESWWE